MPPVMSPEPTTARLPLLHHSWYATLSVLVGVDPSDVYKGHDVDSIDIWPMITGANLTNPREYLPVTEQSLIWKGQWKYFFSSDSPFGFDGWSDQNNTMIRARPGVAPACKNCLFDILNDPTEMKDLSGCVALCAALILSCSHAQCSPSRANGNPMRCWLRVCLRLQAVPCDRGQAGSTAQDLPLLHQCVHDHRGASGL